MRHNFFAYAMCMLVMACTMAKTPAQAVYQIEGDYAAALSLEINYDKLPECGSPTAPLVCKKADVAQMVRKVDDSAWAAISAAQTAVRNPAFGKDKVDTALQTAIAAVAAFTNIVQTLGVH